MQDGHIQLYCYFVQLRLELKGYSEKKFNFVKNKFYFAEATIISCGAEELEARH